MNISDDEKVIDEGEKLEEEDDCNTFRRRKKIILTGVFVENDADIALDKLSSMKSRRF